MRKPFAINPYPWKYINNYTYGENGQNVDVIVDAEGEVVDNSESYGFSSLWLMYKALTSDQIEKLGHDLPKEGRVGLPENEEYVYLIKLDKVYKRNEKYQNLYEDINDSNECKHIDDFLEILWRPLTSRELYKNHIH